ncbi:hypothetical protein Hdeb2414_s0001g00021061 [Helianthus debilis subsp. tardiflorus]
MQVSATTNGSSDDVVYLSSPTQQPANSIHHPPPAFGSSPNLEALALEANESQVQNGDNAVNSYSTTPRCFFKNHYSMLYRKILRANEQTLKI